MKEQGSKYSSYRTDLIVWSIVSLLLFLLIFYSLLSEGKILVIDQWVSTHIPAVQTQAWTKKVIFLTNLNGIIASFIIFAVLTAFFWYKKWHSDLWFFLLSFGGATLLFNLIKFTIERARPDLRIIEAFGYSFPSGHSSTAMALAIALYFIFSKRVDSGLLRVLFLLAAVAWPLMIAFSRVYLNVHWFSDVLAGLALGLFWVMLLKIFYPHDIHKGKDGNRDQEN